MSAYVNILSCFGAALRSGGPRLLPDVVDRLGLQTYGCGVEAEMATEREACADCGFVWDDLDLAELRPRLATAAARLAEAFSSSDSRLVERPSRDVWSPVEYGSHVRDVLLNLRDRVVVGLGEDDPSPKPMYGTLRVDRGMYQGTEPAELVVDLTVAARLFDQTLSTITVADAQRPIFYGWPRPATRTLLWVAAQALHEVEHHLDDIDRTFASN